MFGQAGCKAPVRYLPDNHVQWIGRDYFPVFFFPIDFLASDPGTRSSTSICLKIVDEWFSGLPAEEQAQVPKKMVSLLQVEGAAYDLGSYRDAPPGLRLWGGATVSTSGLEALFPWLEWAYEEVKKG